MVRVLGRGEDGSLLNLYDCDLAKRKERTKRQIQDNRLKTPWFTPLSAFVPSERKSVKPYSFVLPPFSSLWSYSDESYTSLVLADHR